MDLPLGERESREVWEAGGMRTMEGLARGRARAILATHVVEPLPDDVLRDLAAIVERADADLGQP